MGGAHDGGFLDSAVEAGAKTLRLAATATAFFLVQPADASAESAADRHLRQLSKLPTSCEQLIGSDGGDVEICRTDFKSRIAELQQFVATKEVRGLTVLNSKTKEKQRCAQALPILTAQKGKMLEIARFLGAEIAGDASDPVTKIIAPQTVAELRAKLGRTPNADEFVAYTDAAIEDARKEMASCGLVVRGIMALAMAEGGKVQDRIEKRLPEVFKLIDEAITQKTDVPRMKRAVIAIVSLLSLLESAAEAGAR